MGIVGFAGDEDGLGDWLGTELVSVAGQMVVEIAMIEVTTVVWVWLSGCAGQFVTVGWQEVIVISEVVYIVEVTHGIDVCDSFDGCVAEAGVELLLGTVAFPGVDDG